MPTRRRKKQTPRHLNGENVPENITFSFVTPRDPPKAQNEESLAVSNQPEDDDCAPEDIELSPAKKIKLIFGENLEEIDPEVATDFRVPPQMPFRVVPVSLLPRRFAGIPIGRFSVNLECEANLGRLLAADTATRVSLVWASNGLPQLPHPQFFKSQASGDEVVPVQHFVSVVLKSEALCLPAKIEPALQTLDTIESLYRLGGATNHQKYLKLGLAAEDGEPTVNFPSSRSFEVDIFASDKLCEFDNPSELPRKSNFAQNCRGLVEGLYPGAAAPTSERGKECSGAVVLHSQRMSIVATIRKFYEDVQRQRREKSGPDVVFDTASIPGLTADLRGYQQKAVAWMLQKEKGETEERGVAAGEEQGPLHMFWTELPSAAGRPVYFNSYTGRLSSQRFSPHPWPRGGILADEMGLGKTVEILALVMAHRWPGESGSVARGDNQGSPEASAADVPSAVTMDTVAMDTGSEAVDATNYTNRASTHTLASTAENGSGVQVESGTVTEEGSAVAGPSNREAPPTFTATDEASIVNSHTHKPGIAPPTTPPTIDAGTGSPQPVMSTLGYYLAQLDKEASESRHLEESSSAMGTGMEPGLDPDTQTLQSAGTTTITCENTPPLTTQSEVQSPTDAATPTSHPLTTASASATAHCGMACNNSTTAKTPSSPGPAAIKAPSRPSTPQPAEGATLGSPPQTPAAARSPQKGKGDIVACVCGATTEEGYEGEFVQCEFCERWQHSECVGFDSLKHATFYCTKCLFGKPLPRDPTHRTTVPRTASSPRKKAGDVISCVCRATTLGNYEGEFVQCERCDVWQHSTCGGFDSSKHSSFACVKCLLDGEHLPAGTTLIISPQSIVQQWMEEIWKHTESEALSVLHYRGVQVAYVSPLELASYDVVLVTYETLREELNYANSHEVRRALRHRKRYAHAPSPLPAVLWWRICLDEAQMVESTHAKAAEMTQKLSAVNRWCVTGTPVQKDLLDLYGLLLFLDVDPYIQFGWFNQLVWRPFAQGREEAMLSLFARLMWRNSKTDVADELHLPPQTEELHWLSFSPVEDYFYRRQQETCTSEVTKVLSRLPEGNLALSGLLQSTVQRLMTPLHSLRQACCHPQIVRGGYLQLPVNMSNRNCLTMPDLLEKLIQQAKVEGREALRQMVAALNGLAALHIIHEEWPQAVSAYREAMLSWQEHEDHLECDKLQRIHTMENLSELLREGRGEDTHTLRDDRLTEEAGQLRAKYMEKPEGQVRVAAEALGACKQAVAAAETQADLVQAEYLGELPNDSSEVPVESNATATAQTNDTATFQPDTAEQSQEAARDQADSVGQQQKKPATPSVQWWMSAIQWAVDHVMSHDLLEEVNAELSANQDLPLSFTQLNFRDTRGMQLLLHTHTHKLQELRTSVLDYLEQLAAPPTPDLVIAAATCHLRRDNGLFYTNTCALCQAEQVTVEYERQLFSRYHAADEGLMRSEHGDGSRGMSVFERILRCTLVFARHKRAPRKLIESAQTFLAYLEALKKEYKAMRSLWLVADQRLCACDELRMAATRLRLPTPSEMLEEQDIPFVVPVFELQSRRFQFQSDKAVAKSELTKSLGQLLYLKNLTKAQEAGEQQCSEPCPVCTRPLGKEWGVFTCGHPLCMECTFTMVRLQRQRMPWGYREVVSIRCPLCRISSLSTEIHYVRTSSGQEEETPVKGSHSTKIVGITRVLLNIRREQPGAKSLVFSSWLEILDLIARALRDNDIKFSFLKTKRTFQQNLTEFKTSPDVNVLLLPVHSGSKGLNIVEATHVLLVEPSLNIGAELQAVGRVHRMGQTKPTTVHRFYIKHTVEERIHELLTSHADKTKFLMSNERESALTLEELQELFQD